MTKYTIFIDETGKFIRNDPGFVGGWVCKNYQEEALKLKLENSISGINQEIESQYGKECQFSVSKNMHMAALHHEEYRKGNDKSIKVPVEKVSDLVINLLTSLLDEIVFAFLSNGSPVYFANEQSNYIEILRATLIQLIDEKIFVDKNITEIKIIIGTRRSPHLMGGHAYENSQNKVDYENILSNNLLQELFELFPDYKNILKIEILPNPSTYGLKLADLFCGAIVYKEKNYMNEYYSKNLIRQYDIQKSFTYVSNNTISRLKYFFTFDKVSAFIQGLEYLAFNDKNIEFDSWVNEMFSSSDIKTLQSLHYELNLYLEKEIFTSKIYNKLDQIDRFLILLNEKLIYTKITRDSLIIKKFKALVLKYGIKIDLHKGNTKSNLIKAYFKLLNESGTEIYGNIYFVENEKLEILLSVSVQSFNSFDFEEYKSELEDKLSKYLELFNKTENILDENLARLEGTLGQIYGFLASYPKHSSENYFYKAEELLKNDVKHLIPKSNFWFQGLGYLSSLYFKEGDINNLKNNLIQEGQFLDFSDNDFYNLENISDEQIKKTPFLILHRLYLCSLAFKVNNQEIINKDSLKNLLFNLENNKSNYPHFLTLKWLGVLYMMENNFQTAKDIFTNITNSEKEPSIIKVLKLPIRLLLFICNLKLNSEDNLNLPKILAELERDFPGIQEHLFDLGIEKYLSNDYNSWDFYEIASFLPFYYS